MSVLSPLTSSFLGYDRLFDSMDFFLSAPDRLPNTSYPPLNIFKEKDGYTIELALAGFKKSQIKVEHNKRAGVLEVSGSNAQETSSKEGDFEILNAERKVIRQSIAARKFSRSFTVADDLEVQEATFEDGLLTIKLKHVVLEEHKPLQIEIK